MRKKDSKGNSSSSEGHRIILALLYIRSDIEYLIRNKISHHTPCKSYICISIHPLDPFPIWQCYNLKLKWTQFGLYVMNLNQIAHDVTAKQFTNNLQKLSVHKQAMCDTRQNSSKEVNTYSRHYIYIIMYYIVYKHAVL